MGARPRPAIVHEAKWLVKHIVLCCIILAILPLTIYYLDWRKQAPQRTADVTHTPFFLAHVFDPHIEGYQYTSWRRDDWINWLNVREIKLKRVSHSINRKTLDKKGINSVIIATPSEIMNSFGTSTSWYAANNEEGMVWSDALFSSVVFTWNGNMHRIYKCPPMYFAVKLELRRQGRIPVHLHGQSPSKQRNAKARLSRDCEVVHD